MKRYKSAAMSPALDFGAHQLSWVFRLYSLTQPFFLKSPMPWYIVTWQWWHYIERTVSRYIYLIVIPEPSLAYEMVSTVP